MKKDEVDEEINKLKAVIKELSDDVKVIKNLNPIRSQSLMNLANSVQVLKQEMELVKKQLPAPLIPEVKVIPKKKRAKKK